MIEILINYLNNILIALIILFIGLILGKFIARLFARLLYELSIYRWLKKIGVPFLIEQSVERFTGLIIYFIAIYFALDQVGLLQLALIILIVAISVYLVFYISIAVIDFAPDFLAYLFNPKEFHLNDNLTMNKTKIKIYKKGIVNTYSKVGKEILLIPNSTLLKKFKKN